MKCSGWQCKIRLDFKLFDANVLDGDPKPNGKRTSIALQIKYAIKLLSKTAGGLQQFAAKTARILLENCLQTAPKLFQNYSKNCLYN